MPHPDDYRFHIEQGCRDVSHCLGIQKMPEPYSLMLDADEMYFFWMNRETGVESVPTWDKWACYRGAKTHAPRAYTSGRSA